MDNNIHVIHGNPFCVSVGTNSTFTGIFPLLERATAISYENGMINNTFTSSNLNFAFIMLVCCIVFGMCLIGNALSSNNKVRNIVFSSLLIFFFFVYVYLGKDGIENYMTVGVGGSFLGVFEDLVKTSIGLKVGMVLTGFTLAGGIVQAALPDKK